MHHRGDNRSQRTDARRYARLERACYEYWTSSTVGRMFMAESITSNGSCIGRWPDDLESIKHILRNRHARLRHNRCRGRCVRAVPRLVSVRIRVK